MKFTVNKVLIWLLDESLRTLEFVPNKINIITGPSATGKTSVINILDYCLLSSSNKIATDVIGNSAAWYGIQISFGERIYTIGRKSSRSPQGSNEFYFSATGELPLKMTNNTTESIIKKLLSVEFGLDNRTKVPYGGNYMAKGAQTSFRTFLAFNILRGDTIDSHEVFFDRMNIPRVKEQLVRVFGMALVPGSFDNMIFEDERKRLVEQLKALLNRENSLTSYYMSFSDSIVELFGRAQSLGLAPSGLFNVDQCFEMLTNFVSDDFASFDSSTLELIDRLKRSRREVTRRLTNIKLYESQLVEYRKSVEKRVDSLEPVEFLKRAVADLIDVPSYGRLLVYLEQELASMRKTLRDTSPLPVQLSDLKAELESELKEVDFQIASIGSDNYEYIAEAKRLMFFGELKAKLELFDLPMQSKDVDLLHSQLIERRNAIDISLENYKDARTKARTLLEDYIEKYMKMAGSALPVYSSYTVKLDLSNLNLSFADPRTGQLVVTGSSSSDLFFHICLHLGLHDFFLSKKSPYVPQFLVLDQLSRPYYEASRRVGNDDGLIDDDRAKLTSAFHLIDSFLEGVIQSGDHFQFIVLEHVAPADLELMNLKHYHLVEDFRDGNALIPWVS